jgi:sugar lactone lactonase YvrE
MYVADHAAHRVVRIDASAHASAFAGTGQAGFAGDGAAATAAQLQAPEAVRGDAGGNVYMLDQTQRSGNRIRKVDSDGKVRTVYQAQSWVADFLPGADGALYVAEWRMPMLDEMYVKLVRVAPDGTASDVVPESANLVTIGALAQAPNNGVYLLTSGALRRWSAANGLETVKQDDRFGLTSSEYGGAVADAQGRIYIASGNTIVRYEPAGDRFVAIAGAGSSHFAGAGVDDSLKGPRYPALDKTGSLFFSDVDHRQVKRIPAGEL